MMEINKIANLLNLEHVKFLISIFKENNIEIRLVGGCIRDALLEREIKDIDTATTLEPQDVLSLLKGNNIESVSYTHLRAHETLRYRVWRRGLEKK